MAFQQAHLVTNWEAIKRTDGMLTVICLVHNAPFYVQKFIDSFLKHPPSMNHELILFDNASNDETASIVNRYKCVAKTYRSGENLYFAKGNNMAFNMRSPNSTKTLLVNSDVEILSPRWIEPLLIQGSSAAGYGVVYSPTRPDGWGYLIDTKLYNKYKLDENFPFWYCITKLTAQLLSENKTVCAIIGYDKYIKHYGGKSGPVSKRELDVNEWFKGRPLVKVIDAEAISV